MYGECTMHYIKSSTLDKLVDEAVRKIARYVLRNEQAFLEQVRVLTSADQKHTQSEDKKELVNIKKGLQSWITTSSDCMKAMLPVKFLTASLKSSWLNMTVSNRNWRNE